MKCYRISCGTASSSSTSDMSEAGREELGVAVMAWHRIQAPLLQGLLQGVALRGQPLELFKKSN